MCSPAKCPQCGKTTYRGCGQHVAQIKAMVPASDWCNGHSAPQPSANTSSRLG